MPLAVSRSKADFLRSLELTNDDPIHRHVYVTMKREAVDGRTRLCGDRQNLVPQCRDDLSVQLPFSSSQIMETAMHREVLRIFAGASGVTRPYYERGRYMDGGNEDNWVIRWMLWNIFRYGMNRRRNNGISCFSASTPLPKLTA